MTLRNVFFRVCRFFGIIPTLEIRYSNGTKFFIKYSDIKGVEKCLHRLKLSDWDWSECESMFKKETIDIIRNNGPFIDTLRVTEKGATVVYQGSRYLLYPMCEEMISNLYKLRNPNDVEEIGLYHWGVEYV